MNINKYPLKLEANVRAVIPLFLNLPGTDRVRHIMQGVQDLKEDEVDSCVEKVIRDFGSRHRNLREILLDNFQEMEKKYDGDLPVLSTKRKLLLGAFLTKEYSIQSAALFNPSIVSHPNQEGVKPGQERFVMSLRATGEGHISSIVFQTGIIDEADYISLDIPTGFYTRLRKNEAFLYEKKFLQKLSFGQAGFDRKALDLLPDSFTASEAKMIFGSQQILEKSVSDSISRIEEMLDTNYELNDSSHIPFNEKVIFPTARGESMGMEDLRFVKFRDEKEAGYYGTYTAYDGKQIKTQLVETKDFNVFSIRTLYGHAINDKGMALFPEKVNGKFAMISRQGGENISIMFSEDLYRWDNSQILMKPLYSWELVQLGNCGSPIKTDKGWLLLTHGVGMMRTYVISAILLDLDDPTLVIGRLNKPLIEADELEREGYVPNVVYTCGLLLHHNNLIIPYAVSDSATGFITIPLADLLNEFKL